MFASEQIVQLRAAINEIDHNARNVLTEIQLRAELGDVNISDTKLKEFEDAWHVHVKRINEDSARLLVELWGEQATRTRKTRK